MALSENEKRRFENRYRGIVDQKSDPFDALPDSVKARLYKRKSTLEKNAGDVPASKRKHIYSEFGTGVETEFRNNLPGLAQEYARKRAERERTLPLIGAGVYEAMTGNNMPSLALEYAQERAAQGYKRPSLKDTDFRNKVLENAFTGLQLSQMAMKGSPSAKDTAAEYMATKDSQSKRKPYTLRNTPYDQDLAVYTPPEVEEKRRREKFENVGFYDQNDEFVRYDGLERQSDFPEMVKSGKEKDNVFNANYGLIDYLNKDKRDVMKAANTNFTYMTDTEKDLYYYLNAKYGAKAASNYVESINKELNRRSAEYATAQAQKLGKEHPILGTVADTAFATVGSGAYPWIVAKTVAGKKEIDPNDPAFGADILNSGIRSGMSENETLKTLIPNEGARNFAIGTGLSMAENIGRLPMGYLGLGVAAGGAGLSATREATERGGTANQAIAYGAANAAAEAFFEKFSLENLKSLKAAPGKGVRIFLRNIGKQALTEGSEEVFTEIANTVSDQVIMRELSNYNLELEYYKSQGMSEEEAKQKAFGTFLSNVALAGAGGAVSGGLMGGGGQLLGNYELSQYGKSIDHDYRDVAAGIDIRPESYATAEDQQQAVNLQNLAQEYAARQANKETISNREKAEFELQLESFNYGAQARKKALDSILAEDQEPPAQQNHEPGGEQPDASVQRPTTSQNSPEAAQMRETAPTAQKSDSVAYNAPESNVSALEEWAKPFGTEGQDTFKALYDGETDMGAYYRAFGRAYNIGRYNMQPTPQHRAEAAVILGVDGFSEAFKAGAHDRPEIGYDRKTGSLNGMVMGSPKEGGLGTVAPSATEAQKKAATHIGKLTGLQIDLVDGLNNQNAAASYSKGKITLSVNSSDFMGSAAHELTHYIKDYAPDAYQVYSDHAVRAITEAQGVDLETMINDYISTYEQQTGQQLSREEAVDEIVADATQKFLNDPDFISRAIKEDSTIGQRIIDFLTDVIDAIKELVKVGSTRRAAKALEENLQYFERCRQEWMIGLEEAGERYKAGWETDTDTKYQLNQFGLEEYTEREKQNLANEINIICNSKADIKRFVDNINPAKLQRLFLGNIGPELGQIIKNKTGIDITGYSLVIRSDNVTKIFKDHGSDKEYKRGQIPVTVDDIAAIPQIISEADKIERTTDTDMGKPAIRFEKNFRGKDVVIEYVSDKRRMLYTQTMWINKKNPPTTEDVQAPSLTPKAVSGTDSNNSIAREKSEGKVRFQLKEPVEETKDLIAVHNLSEEKLLGDIRLGGLPMPSIAITKADIGHSNFGDISLIFRKDTIDPKNRKNKVYGADAWTPTFPRIEYEADPKVSRDIENRVTQLSGALPDEYANRARSFVAALGNNLNNYGGQAGIVEQAFGNYGMKAVYLASKGEPVEVKTLKTEEAIPQNKQTIYKAILDELGEDIEQAHGKGSEVYGKYGDRAREAYRRGLMSIGADEDMAWDMAGRMNKFQIVQEMRNALKYRETGDTIITEAPDYAGTEKSIDDRIDQGEYRKWLNDLFQGVEKRQGIYNGKEYITPSGNRRSFSQLHLDVTVENIVKAMLAQTDDVRNVAGWNGIKSIRAIVTDDFKSIDQIKKKSNRLRDVNTETYNKQLEEMENRLYAVIGQIVDAKGGSGNHLIDIDMVGKSILEACKNPTAQNILKTLRNYHWPITNAQAQEIANIANEVYNMPVNMFEAKPQRVVNFDEIAAAVIPLTASEDLKLELEAVGINAVQYDPNLPDARREAVNTLKDVRFQLEDVDNVDARALQQENKTLREANELLRRELELTGKTEPRLSDVKKVATELLRQHNSDYRHETLTRNLIGLYEYLRSADQVDMAQAAELAAGIAKGVLKKAKSTSEYAQQYEDLRQQIRDTKIQITDQDKADLMRMGGYNNFRKQYFGKMKLGNDGISIDAFYQELADQHPELFDANVTHPADQLMAVATAIDTMTAQVANPYGADMDEMSYIVGQEILQAYSRVREVPATFADKKAAEIQQVRRDYNKKMSEYKNDLKKKYDQALKQVWRENSAKIDELAKEYRELKDARMVDRAEYRTKMDRLRNDKNLALAAMQQRHREQLQQRRDSLRAREAKKRIIKDTREMHRWLTEPNDKKHVPESLRTPVAQFLLSIDFSSDWTDQNGGPAQRTIIWKDMSKQLNSIVEAGGIVEEQGEQRILNVDPSLPGKINELADKVKLLPRLEELDANQLERLQESVTAMKKLIQDANQMISNANYRNVETAATSFLSDVSKKKDAVEFSENSYVGKGKNLFQNDLLDSNSAFYRMGPVMRSIYQEIRDAEDRHTANLVTMERYFHDTCQELGITKEELREWTGPKAKQMTFIVDGKAVKMTAAQLMTLYESDKRGQAKKHIYSKGGGIIPSELIRQKENDNGKAKTSVLGRMNPKPKPVHVTEQDVQRITSVLTPKQIAFADKLQYFLGHVTSEWGNETSMKMYGYKKFTASNYFPIEVYQNAIHKDTVDVGMNALASIKNIGAAKATSEKAGNALVLNDIMDVYIKHSNQMSIYNAMLAPLSDFQKVYNYKSGEAGNVKEEIERAWGKGGAKYLDTLIKDINGRVDNPDPGMYGKLMQNMKAAAVAGNLRVAIQQPTAMVRAAAELSLMDLGKGAITKSPTLSRKEQWDVMCKYAPITQWKDWGFFKMDTSKTMRDVLMGTESPKQAFVDKFMWAAAKGDELAWRHMWNACEYEVMRSNPELEPGSDAYYRKVGSRFSTVIDKTQVVDSVLHRTQIMRNSDGLVKMSVAFMNEPLKSYNMLYRAFVDARESGNYKAVRTAAVIYAANAITTALAASLVDMWRDDDKDKKLWEKYLNALMGNAIDGLNPLNMIPLVKDIWSIFQGYSTKRTDLSGIEDIQKVTGKWLQYFQGDSKYTIPYLIMETMDSTSIITGVPVRNLNRDIIKPLIRSLYSVWDGDEYRALKLKYDIGSEKNLGYYADMMVDAMIEGDQTRMEQIKADMLEAGLENEDISSRYDSEYRKYLKDNVPEIEEAAQARIDGKPEEYKRLYDEIVVAGYDPTYVKKAIDTAMNKLKSDIEEAAQARIDGKEKKYKRLYGDLIEDGYDPTYVKKAIDTATNKPRSGTEESEEKIEETKEEEPKAESIYSTYDLLAGVEQVSNTTQSLKAFSVVAEDMYQAKLSNGKKKSEAIGEIKSLITKAYKKQWIEAYQRKDKATYQAIQNKLKYLKIGGATIYGSSDWESWLKEAKKNK